ncbi:MAG: hypothetical protein WC314_27325 [Vulcanimicrobiota bacterium]
MKRIIILIAAALLVGCGSSGGGGVPGTNRPGNFLSTTVEIEQRYLYVLDSEDPAISIFTFPLEVEEGHGHGHAHAQAMNQETHEDDHDHDHEGSELDELENSPFALDHLAIDMAVVNNDFLATLDPAGAVRSFALNRTGLESKGLLNSGVSNPRRLLLHSGGVAVLGDSLVVLQMDGFGEFSTLARIDATVDWVDAKLNGGVGAASTSVGAVGFSLDGGGFEVPLPGAGRGELAYAAEGLYVLNTADGSVSLLSQGSDGSLALERTIPLGTLSNPTHILALFDGEDLLIANSDSVGLFHPHEGDLEEEGFTALEREPVRLFHVPESELIYVGHAEGEGSTLVRLEETGLETADESGPGHHAPSAFGVADRVDLVTVTSGI